MAGEVFVSGRAFAKEIGLSYQWVYNKIREGIFPVNSDKQLPLEKCKAIFDALQAQKRVKAKSKNTVLLTNSDGSEKVDITPCVRFEDDDESESTDNPSSSAIQMKYAIAKANEKTALAGLRGIELRLRKGEILERSVVEADAANVASFMRNALLSLPARYSALLYGQAQRKIQEILEDAVEEVLQGLQKSKFLNQ